MALLLITLPLSQGWPYSHLCMCIFFLQLNYFSRKAHIQYHLLPRTTIIPFVLLRFSPVVLSPQYWRLKVYFSPALKKPAGLLGGLESRLKRAISDLLLRPQPRGSSHSSGCLSAAAAPGVTQNQTISMKVAKLKIL